MRRCSIILTSLSVLVAAGPAVAQDSDLYVVCVGRGADFSNIYWSGVGAVPRRGYSQTGQTRAMQAELSRNHGVSFNTSVGQGVTCYENRSSQAAWDLREELAGRDRRSGARNVRYIDWKPSSFFNAAR